MVNEWLENFPSEPSTICIHNKVNKETKLNKSYSQGDHQSPTTIHLMNNTNQVSSLKSHTGRDSELLATAQVIICTTETCHYDEASECTGCMVVACAVSI